MKKESKEADATTIKTNEDGETNNGYARAFEHWCLDSTMDGVPNMARAKRSQNLAYFIFWIVFFAASFGLCLYMVIESFNAYFQFNVVTTDRIVAYDNLTFPVITICNENMFLTPQANEFIRGYFRDRHGIPVADTRTYDDLVRAFNGSTARLKREFDWLRYQLSAGVWNESVQRSLGYTPAQFLLWYDFSYELLKPTDFDWYFDKTYGNCYQFNANQTFSASRLGFGLYMEIFTGLPYNYHNYLYEPEFKGVVFEVKQASNYKHVYSGLRMPPSKGFEVTIWQTKSSTLPKPYSDCSSSAGSAFSSPVFDEMNRLGIEYEKPLCIDALKQYKTVRQFGCANAWLLPFFNTYNVCLDRSLVVSSEQRGFDSISVDLNEIDEMCPLDCDEEVYDLTTSSLSFPTTSSSEAIVRLHQEYLKQIFSGPIPPSVEAVKSSWGLIKFSLRQITVREMSEVPAMEVATLVSNVGGNMNLFIGPSFLTFSEIFELIFVFVAIWWTRRKMRRQKTIA